MSDVSPVITGYEVHDFHKTYDWYWLEETHTGPLSEEIVESVCAIDPEAIRDKDQDGYREVRRKVLAKVMDTHSLYSEKFPLASYFADRKNAAAYRWRLDLLPPALRKATASNDFWAARQYFTETALKKPDNPLKAVAKLLALHLASTAMHAGVNVADTMHIDSPTGFSVHGGGRLRFDCALFAELARSNLQDIPGLELYYVILTSRDKPMDAVQKSFVRNTEENQYEFYTPDGLEDSAGHSASHLIFYAKDGMGYHLIVSNTSVLYFKAEASWMTFKRVYQEDFNKLCFLSARGNPCLLQDERVLDP